MEHFALLLSLKPSDQMRKLEELVITRYPSIRREVQTVWVEPNLSFATRLVKAFGMHYNTEPQIDPYLAEIRAEGAAIGEYLTFFWRRAGLCVVSCETFRVISQYLGQKEACVLLQLNESAVWTTESEYCRPCCEESDCQLPASGPVTSAIPLLLPASQVVETVTGAKALREGLESKVQELFQWGLETLQGLQTAASGELETVRGKLALLQEEMKQRVQAYKDQLSGQMSALRLSLQLVSQVDTRPSKALTAPQDTEALLLPQLRSVLSTKLQQWQARPLPNSHYPVLYTGSVKSEYAEMKVYVVNFKRVRYCPAWVYVEMDTGRAETVSVEEGIRPGLQTIRFSDASHFQDVSQLTLSLWTAGGSEMHQISSKFQVSFLAEKSPFSLPSLSPSSYDINAPSFLRYGDRPYSSFRHYSGRSGDLSAWEISEKYNLKLELVENAVKRIRAAGKEVSVENVLAYSREM